MEFIHCALVLASEQPYLEKIAHGLRIHSAVLKPRARPARLPEGTESEAGSLRTMLEPALAPDGTEVIAGWRHRARLARTDG